MLEASSFDTRQSARADSRPGLVTHAVMQYVRDATLWAVELTDGWIPTRAVELRPDQADCDFAQIDWSNAVDATRWNVSNLIALCQAGRQRVTEGRRKVSRAMMGSTGRRDLPGARLDDHPGLREARDQASRAFAAVSNDAQLRLSSAPTSVPPPAANAVERLLLGEGSD